MSDTTVGIGIDFSTDLESVKKIASELQKSIASATQSAMKSGAKAGLSVDNVIDALQGVGGAFQKELVNAQKAAMSQIKSVQEKANKDILNARNEQEKQNIKENAKLEIKAIVDQFNLQKNFKSTLVKQEISGLQKGYDEIGKSLKEASEQAGKGFKANAKEGFKTLQSLGGNIKGLNFQGVAGNVSDLIKQGGKYRQGKMLAKAKALKAAGDTAGAAKMASAAKALGGASMAMAGVVVGLGAIIALLAKAFDGMQKMNKEILEQASVIEVASMSSGNLLKGLKEIRSVAVDSRMFMNGIKPEQVFGLVGAFGNANLTLKQLTKTAKDSEERMTLLSDTIFKTTAVARVLGVKAEELGGSLAKMMDEQGGSYDTMMGQFAGLSKMAQNSGFQQKYFYQTVLESVSGLALYNARVAESGNLLIQLGKILGKDMAKSTLQELSKGFKSEGIAESYKRVLKTGQGLTKEIFQKEAQVASQQFLNTIGDQAPALQDVFKSIGVNLDLSGSAEENAKEISKALGGLSGKQQERLIGEMIADGRINRNQARQISNLVDLSKAAKGDRVAMAAAMDELGPGGVLQMQLNAVQGVLKTNKKFHEMTSFAELKVLEDVGGFSREQIERLKEISLQAHAQFGQLEMLKQQGYVDHATAKQQIEKFGAYINENGEIVSAQLTANGEEINKATERQVTNANELVALQMAYQQSEIEPAMKEAEYWSREQAIATVSLSDIMSGAILAVLETIAGYLVPIVSWVTGSLDDEERQAKQEAVSQISGEERDTRKLLLENKQAIREQEKILKTSGNKEDREKAVAELEKLNQRQKSLEKVQQGLAYEKSKIEGYNYRDTAFFGMESVFGEENDIARKRLSSAKDFRDVAKGGGVRGGGFMGTGLSASETLTLGTIGAATGGYGLAGGAMLTTAGGALGGGLIATGTGAGISSARGDESSAEKSKREFEEKHYQDYQNEVGDKQLTELENIGDVLKSNSAGSALAQTQIGSELNYGGGVKTTDLTALGKSAQTEQQKADLRKALETSGFTETQRATVLSGMNDGLAYFSGNKATVVPLASQDDVSVLASRQGGPVSQMGGGKGGNTFNFYGGSTAEIIAHFERIQSAGGFA